MSNNLACPKKFRQHKDKTITKDLEIFYKKKNKIKETPLRQKHLSGGQNCYREPITSNISWYIPSTIKQSGF
jgi:hypothetical protein